MIRCGFLCEEDRRDLIELARDGLSAHRLGRRANALVLLDQGWSCEEVAVALFVDDDTVRDWYRRFCQEGLDGLWRFDVGGSASFLSAEQEIALVAWIGEKLPVSTREIGAFIEKEFRIFYESRSGLISLLHRLGVEYRKPTVIGRQLDVVRQEAFIAGYEALLNGLRPDEAVVFADAVHPTHGARPAGCWAPKDKKLALLQTSGRERLNIHGAIDLETGQTRMIEDETVDATSTIRLLTALEAAYPRLRRIHVFLDNARYHFARKVQAFLARPGCRIRLHSIPSYCPHLNPIERLWGVMHKHITHNRCYPTLRKFANAILAFLRDTVPRNWDKFRDSIIDNFRVINPKLLRVLT